MTGREEALCRNNAICSQATVKILKEAEVRIAGEDALLQLPSCPSCAASCWVPRWKLSSSPVDLAGCTLQIWDETPVEDHETSS
jgi:hypothetical protein